jgi:hypothetical protein
MHSSLLQHRRCVLQGPAAAHSWPACSSRLFPSRRNSTCNQAASSSSSNSSNFGHRAVAAAAQPTAVITGCSTGIGRDTALKLAQNVSLYCDTAMCSAGCAAIRQKDQQQLKFCSRLWCSATAAAAAVCTAGGVLCSCTLNEAAAAVETRQQVFMLNH